MWRVSRPNFTPILPYFCDSSPQIAMIPTISFVKHVKCWEISLETMIPLLVADFVLKKN